MNRATLWGIATVGLFIPAALALVIAFTPDTLTGTFDAGQFVEASGATVGGFFSSGATTVQSSNASVVVSGQFSAARGQPLVIERRVKSGFQLCLRGTRHCASVAGGWPGEMTPVPHVRHITDWLAVNLGFARIAQWMVIGLFAWFMPFSFKLAQDNKKPAQQSENSTAG